MAFGQLLELVGGTGRFQILHVSLLCTTVLMMASHNLLQNFVASVPQHYCNAPKNLSRSPLSPGETLLVTVPLDPTGKPLRCRRYATPQWHLLPINATSSAAEQGDTEDSLDAELQGCTDGWSYNFTHRSTSIISEWDLVCDLRSLKQMGQTIYMGGVLVGALVFGDLSDRYGRRILLLVSYLLMAVAGTCATFSNSFSLFCLFRFGCGMAVSGQSINGFSLILEWCPTRVRTVVGTAASYCYTMGQLILVAIAYFVRDWRWLTLAVSSPYYVFFLYAWWYHESPRWLVLKNRSEEAVRNLKSVAKINGRHDEADKIDVRVLEECMKKEMSSMHGSYSFLDLFRTTTMRKMTISLSAVWLSTSFAYYGLVMDLERFGVDFYLIQLIFGVVDIPAKVVVTVTMSLIGRRASQAGTLILAGVTILINLLVPDDQLIIRTCLAVFGKGCLAASFNCCYLYAGELLPTIIRQSGMGCVSMMARVGSMVAPMVALTEDYVPWLPGLIYGGAPILSGLAALFLPETRGSPLPETVQDVEDRGSGRGSGKTKEKVATLQDTQTNLLKQAA